MKFTRAAVVTSLIVLSLSAGLLLAQSKGKGDYKNPEVPMADDGSGPMICVGKVKGRPIFPVGFNKDEPVCRPDAKSFNHKFHDATDAKFVEMQAAKIKEAEAKKDTALAAALKQYSSCGGCHVGLSDPAKLRAGESLGDVRRPGHKTCLACHGISNDPKVPSFYETDPKKRTICENCHVDALDDKGNPIPGSYNDMTKPLKVIAYGASVQGAGKDAKSAKAAQSLNPPCNVDFGFDFSHKAHATQTCQDCHEPIRDCSEYKKGPDGKVILNAYGNPAECAVSADGKEAKTPCDRQVLTTPSHPQCWTCHNSKNSKDPQAAAKVTQDDCEACHSQQARASGSGNSSAFETYFSKGYHKNRDFWAERFTHDNHMSYVTKAAPSAPKDAQCRLCHQSQVEAGTLAEVGAALFKDIDQKNTCFCCHNNKVAFGPTNASLQFKCLDCHRGSAFEVPAGTHKCTDPKKFDEINKTLFGSNPFK